MANRKTSIGVQPGLATVVKGVPDAWQRSGRLLFKPVDKGRLSVKERIDYSHEVRKHDSRAMRLLFVVLGFSCVGVGIAGVILPVLPATPFFLLAAACFARASERFYNWLLNNRSVGPAIREWRRYRSIRYRTKLFAIALMASTLAISIIFFIADPYLKAGLAILGVLLAIWMWRIPSRDAPGFGRPEP